MTETSIVGMYELTRPDIIRATSAPRKNRVQPEPACETFFIKGPIGKGLGVQPSGTHVAFAAGTGVLVFLDLMTRIILHNTGIADYFDDTFKFVFYISHRNLGETMGLDLGLKLMELNSQLKQTNFKLVIRISEGNPEIPSQRP
jgi:hypothetical protein